MMEIPAMSEPRILRCWETLCGVRTYQYDRGQKTVLLLSRKLKCLINVNLMCLDSSKTANATDLQVAAYI